MTKRKEQGGKECLQKRMQRKHKKEIDGNKTKERDIDKRKTKTVWNSETQEIKVKWSDQLKILNVRRGWLKTKYSGQFWSQY